VAELGLGELAPLDRVLPKLAVITIRLPLARDRSQVPIDRHSAESVGFEPTVPSRVHLISNQAPSATRTALRPAPCRHRTGVVKRSSGRAMPLLARALLSRRARPGEMTEWSKVHDWKSCVPATVPRVRIPLSPQGNTESYEAASIVGSRGRGRQFAGPFAPPSTRPCSMLPSAASLP
jgi:hypothetical protein